MEDLELHGALKSIETTAELSTVHAFDAFKARLRFSQGTNPISSEID
jgi:hypothetical protein